jgi:hypothetical protein
MADMDPGAEGPVIPNQAETAGTTQSPQDEIYRAADNRSRVNYNSHDCLDSSFPHSSQKTAEKPSLHYQPANANIYQYRDQESFSVYPSYKDAYFMGAEVTKIKTQIPVEPPPPPPSSSSCYSPRLGDQFGLETACIGQHLAPTSYYSTTLAHMAGNLDTVGDTLTDSLSVLTCVNDNCDSTFTGEHRKGNLKRHIRICHGHGHGDPEYFKCEVEKCGRKFRRKDALLQHQRMSHPELVMPPVKRRRGIPTAV